MLNWFHRAIIRPHIPLARTSYQILLAFISPMTLLGNNNDSISVLPFIIICLPHKEEPRNKHGKTKTKNKNRKKSGRQLPHIEAKIIFHSSGTHTFYDNFHTLIVQPRVVSCDHEDIIVFVARHAKGKCFTNFIYFHFVNIEHVFVYHFRGTQINFFFRSCG